MCCVDSFICGIFHGAVTLSEYIAPNGKTINQKWTGKNLEGSDRDRTKALYRHLLAGTNDNHENLNQDSWGPDRDSDQKHPKMLPLH
jgi:hypothetical protein